jgi:hypothetical protein
MKRLISSWAKAPLPSRVAAGFVGFWLALAVAGPWLAPHPVGAFVDYDVFSGLSSNSGWAAIIWAAMSFRDCFMRRAIRCFWAGRGIAGGLLRHMSCALGHAGRRAGG